MPKYLDDYVCELTCEEYYDDGWDEDERRAVKVANTVDLDSWSNW